MKFFERFKQLNRMSFFNKNLGKSQRYTAFTLAEVLIVLSIIGIVAELTIPELMEQTQNLEYKTAWKNEYSTINQAYEQLRADNSEDLSSYFSNPTSGLGDILTAMSKYLYMEEISGSILSNGQTVYTYIYNNSYKSLSGSYVSYYNLAYLYKRLKDGAEMFGRYDSRGNASKSKMFLFIDVNGAGKGPDTLGKDLFGLVLTADKLTPMGAVGTGLENSCNKNTISCSLTGGMDGRGDCAGAGCSYEALVK